MATKQTKVEVYGETSKYERSMRNVQRVSRSTSQAIGSHWSKMFAMVGKATALFGVAGAAGFVALGKNAIEAGDLIHKLNLRLGISTEALSQYQHMADITGVRFESMTMGLQRMIRRVAEAAQGTGEAKDALKELGLSAQYLASLTPERQFELIADAMLGVTNQSDKVRLAMKLFDSEGVALLQTMTEGAAGIKRMTEEADRLGITLSQEAAQSMADANDAMTRIKNSASGMTRTMMIELAPSIERVADQITKWVGQNRELIGQNMATVMRGLGSAFVFFGESVATAASAYGKFLDLFYGPTGGDPKELAKRGLEKQLELAMRSYQLMVGQGNIDLETLRLAEARIFTLRQRIAMLEADISGPGEAAGPLKLTITEPGTRSPLSQEADMWAKGWANAEEAVQETWRQAVYGFNQSQQQLLSDQQNFADMKKVINDISLQDRVEAEQTALIKIREMNEEQAAREKALRMEVLSSYQQAAGGIANTFMQIAQAGGKQSEEAFKMYQGFAMVEAGIGTALAITKTLGQLGWWGIPLAIAIGAMGAVQIGMIASAQPPSYDQGGISTTPGMYYAGIPEAHVPLKGGAIPVALDRGGGGDTFIIMENPVFQDMETQQAVFASIAERIAPNAVVRAYDNNHAIRGRIRGKA